LDAVRARLGSFEAWAEIVGGMVAFAGIPGFLGNLEALYEKADEGGAEWEGFLSAWWAACGEEPVTVAELSSNVAGVLCRVSKPIACRT
jgi:hypothetical protein